MKKTVQLVLFLAIISFISGLSIGVINSFTEPVIEANAIKAENKNLELIFPGANFEAKDYVDDDGVIIGVYEVENTGYVFKATATGYNSSTPIICLIGMDNDGTIVNVVALEQQETSGVGSKCFETNNIEKLYMNKKLNENIDSITGATFTSNAMGKMITSAWKAYENIK